MATAGVLNVADVSFKTTGTTYAKLAATSGVFTVYGTGVSAARVTNVAAPTAGSDAVNKTYVDSLVYGLTWKSAADVATTANLTATYAAETGTGLSTLTNSGTQAALVIDTYAVSIGDRVLVKNQTTTLQNGIYVVTDIGSVSTNWILTRASDALAVGGPAVQASGAALYVINGDTYPTGNKSTSWVCNTAPSADFGSSITFVIFAQGGGGAAAPQYSIQYNGDGLGAFAGTADFTYTPSGSNDTVALATSNANNNAFINLSNGTGTSTIAAQGTGLMSLTSAGAFTATAAVASNVSLFNTTTTGNITVGAALTNGGGDLTLGTTGGSGQLLLDGSATLTSPANITLTSSATGAIVIGGSMTTGTIDIGAAMTGGTITIGDTAGPGEILMSTSAMTLTSVGTFTATAAVASNVSLFDTTTTGNITVGAALTNGGGDLTLGTTGGSGQLLLNGSATLTSPTNVTITPSATGTIDIGAAMTGGTITIGDTAGPGEILMSTSTITLTSVGTFIARGAAGSNVTLFDTTVAGNITLGSASHTGTTSITAGSGAITISNTGTVNVGSTTSTTVNIGGTATTALNLLATGTSGDIVATAGDSAAAAGDVTVTAGTSSGATGGSVTLVAGPGATAADGGNVILKTSTSSTTTTGSLTNGIIAFKNSGGTTVSHMEDQGDWYGNTFNAVSDKEHKCNIQRIGGALAKVKKVKAYTYDWKESFRAGNNKRQLGLIAQDLTDDDDLKILVNGGQKAGDMSVNYMGLVPVLAEGINELSEKVEKQEEIIAKYETMIANLIEQTSRNQMRKRKRMDEQ